MDTRNRWAAVLLLFALDSFALATLRLAAAETPPPATTVYAEVVALDQPFMFNRLGTAQPSGMIFALRRDVVSNNPADQSLQPGAVMLRPDKRPRPLVLRVNVGQYLEIKFTNLLAAAPTNPPTNTAPTASPTATYSLQPGTRSAGVHIAGLELVAAMDPATGLVQPGVSSDATWVGRNQSSFAAPGQSRTYRYYAKAEGTFLLYSAAGDWNGQLAAGLFGAATVEPPNSEWYRSQVTNADLLLAARPVEPEPDGRPLLDYAAVYPPGHARAGQPILKMTRRRPDGRDELISSDLTAIITGPGAGAFLSAKNGPDFSANPVYPDRRQPFREMTIMYHEIFTTAVQAFQQFYAPQPLSTVLGVASDGFAINYGAAGISAGVLASRLGVGPMGGQESVDLKFEEFFLSSWACGDPAMVVDVPANTPNETVTAPTPTQAPRQTDTLLVSALAAPPPSAPPVPPSTPPLPPQPAITTAFQPLSGAKATKALYPDDPSNVYHSYMRDHVTMRLLHTGTGVTHVHHVHAHQWLRSPNSDNAHYLDSQMIAPGSTYTLEMVYNGGGNRNETAGDAIFHCHFYSHFAGGMWALWRVHDVFEAGTKLDPAGRPLAGWNRALPDGEITAGTPIPAVVPLPTLPMAPVPAPVRLIDHGTRVEVAAKTTSPAGEPSYDNPGFPFFVPGVAGHRAPHPPIDFAWEEERAGQPRHDAKGRLIYLDGGLPRHQVLGGKIVRELHTRWDFSKDFIAYDKAGKPIAGGLDAFELPEEGTAVEQAAMAAHATRRHASFRPDGTPGNFIFNGRPPVPGAPFANPSVDENGNAKVNPLRRYQGAAIQLDVALTKQGWHFPQQRMLTLWQDVAPTLKGDRAPQPLFFRANSGETIEFWHTNLVPNYNELDDFQVRTPTDIIGQHIHLVKFDVLASDGAADGWNYEDGTFSPDEVRGRIDALNLAGGLYNFDAKTQFKGSTQRKLTAKPAPAVFGEAPAGQDWLGAQTTIQRWDTDPVVNNQGEDRTLRTVFTHDHFGPSTHQQAGLYGGLLVEPRSSQWFDPISGGRLYDPAKRQDGGPTSWQANIVTANSAESYREFALEFTDLQPAYAAGSPSTRGTPASALFTITFAPFTAGPVPPAMRDVFATHGVILAASAQIAGSDGTGWLLTSATALGVDDNYKLLKQTSGEGYQVLPQNIAPGWSAPSFAINPPLVDTLPQNTGGPYPTLISSFTTTTPSVYSLNYRAEPIPARVWDPKTNATPPFPQGDLAFAYASIPRADAALNQQPVPGAPINPANPGGFKFPANITPTLNGLGPAADDSKVQPADPFTPVLRAYAGDRVQVRTLVGGQEGPHTFTIDGVKWLYEPGSPNTGFRNNQQISLGEHYEMLFALPAATAPTPKPFADYLYNASAGGDGITNGLWGLMRSYQQRVDQLVPLPNNPPPARPATVPIQPPPGAKVRRFSVVATSAQQALPGGVLVYNNRGQAGATGPKQSIQNSNALLYARAEDLDANGKFKPGVPVEPLILRAAAGEWIELTLTNAFDPTIGAFHLAPAPTAFQPYGVGLPAVTLQASPHAGLNPQVVGYDITTANGLNVGFNPTVTVAPGRTSAPVYWYAGTIAFENGRLKTTPVELGAINLNPSDPLQQPTLGLVGALVIEPEGSTWTEDTTMRAAATVTKSDGTTFRDFVMICQDYVPLAPFTNNRPFTTHSVNYGTEPMAYRFAQPITPALDVSAATANQLVGNVDPQTPIYTAPAGSAVRFRMLHPAGFLGETLAIDGHVFQEEPYTNESRTIGYNPLSNWLGTRGAHGARDRFEAVLASAGGEHKVPGDYLYRSMVSLLGDDFVAGKWGVFRVTAPAAKP